MNNQPTPVMDEQAPARRIGYLIAFVVILFSCFCLIAVTYAFNREQVEILQTSFQLQSNGQTTNGTVVEVQQIPGIRPESSSSFYLFVEFDVDGKTYQIKSNRFYPTRSSSWVGETMPIIYDPLDPSIAQIDSFEERWLYPILDLLPF